MIVGCYTLDLYCDGCECPERLCVAGAILQTAGDCKRYARGAGWIVGKTQAWCPEHAKGKR